MLDRALSDRLLDALMRIPGIEDRSTRTALLKGIGVSLNRADNQYVDLTNILDQLDRLGRLANGERPVVIVANNARRMVPGTDLGRVLEELAKDVEEAYGSEPLLDDVPTEPEALVFGGPGEWVTSTFLEQARLVGTRVARMRVPRIANGVEQHAVGQLGTGWLIGPRLLLTNHHVVNAREPGEPAASAADFARQAKGAVGWFDYYVEGRESVEVRTVDIVSSNAELDYALLRLEDTAVLRDRPPLAVPRIPRALERGMRLNIVQCPDGGPLRYAIRNNFFVGRAPQNFKLRYLTDTKQGSSGSPVMDDDWQVVALHHGAQKVAPHLYKGEPGVESIVKFHNQGIDIFRIIEDLPPAAAAEIAAAQGWI